MAATPRILVVDDDTQITGFLAVALQCAGYRVKTATSARDAIALLSLECFDLLLSDIMMPEMNGHQLAQWVVAHCPETRTALMTGFDATSQGSPQAPRCQLIAKPFSSKEVISFVGQVLASP